jgi:3-isopropylmalate dehydrogenase
MLRYSLGLTEEAAGVERAVEVVLDQGYRTPDVLTGGTRKVTTTEMGQRIADALA